MIIFFFFNGSHNEGLELNSKTILGKKKKGLYQCIQTHAKIFMPFKYNSGQHRPDCTVIKGTPK